MVPFPLLLFLPSGVHEKLLIGNKECVGKEPLLSRNEIWRRGSVSCCIALSLSKRVLACQQVCSNKNGKLFGTKNIYWKIKVVYYIFNTKTHEVSYNYKIKLYLICNYFITFYHFTLFIYLLNN